MAKYRAIRPSFGFRKRYWDIGEIAEGVSPEEQKVIPNHFELVKEGEKTDKPLDPSKEPPEPMTLSEMADQEQNARKSGKEFMEGTPKPRRK